MDIVALLSQHYEQVVWFRNEGNLRFSRRVLYQAPHPAWGYSGMEVVDFDGDGDLDLLLSNGDSLDDDVIKPYHGVAWLDNDGKGNGKDSFVYRHLAALPGCQRAVARDVDGDGDLDVVAVSFLPQLAPDAWKKHDLTSVLWLERDGNRWQPHAVEKHRCIHPTVDVGDLTGDGRSEIVVGNYVFIAEGGATLTPAEFISVFVRRVPAK